MTETRKLVVAVVLMALVPVTWWLARDATQPMGVLDTKARHDPDYIIENFTATEMDERGTPKYTLTADRVTHYPDDDTAHYVHPVLIQYQPNGLQVTTRAQTGVMPGDGREIVMTGDVQVSRAGAPGTAGGEINTERLRVELDRE